MSNFCSICGKEFKSSRVGQKACSECLKSEFSAASKMEEEEVEMYRAKQAAAARRQHARMAKLLDSYKNGTMFNMSGKIMFCVGLFILLFCHLIFFLDGRELIYWGVEGMDESGKKAISMLLSFACVLLLVFSTRRFKIVMMLGSVVILLLGWYATAIWKSSSDAMTGGGIVEKKQLPEPGNEAVIPITEEELSVFYELKKNYPRATHYAVFLDNQEPIVRDLVREALTRLLEAEYTRAYTRSNGVLYVVANAAGVPRNVSPIVDRLGEIVNADVAKGLYLVRFDAEKTNLVCKYSSEVLSSPLNSSFVIANINELRCLDAMRIRVAARSLRNANVQMLRREVRDALVRVLGDSWTQDQDTYSALIDSLVTYASAKDREVINICSDYFMKRYGAKKDVLPGVVDYLIKEVPDQMVQPIIDYWLLNPMSWTVQMRNLSWRVQPKLLERMEQEVSIKDLSLILRYLQNNGNEDAIPAVKKLLTHSDAIIRFSAQETLRELESKASEKIEE